MSYRFLIVVLIVLSASFSDGQSMRLSNQSEIAIMTLGPYQPELYSAFGHSAIRVHDPQAGIDWVYNYGVFDFEQENFYLNFAKGKMVYQLGLNSYPRFRDFYISQDRSVREQYLNLTIEEKQQFFDFLQWNYLPENRAYNYNYVYDNCASKLPEVVNEIFGDRITYDSIVSNKSVRDLMHDYLTYQPWGMWMIDIGLGQQIDGTASQTEYLFLPDYVFEAFETAKITRSNTTVPLVSRTIDIYQSAETPENAGWLTPMNFFILLFFIGGYLTHFDMKRNHRSNWLDVIVFGFAGFVGVWLVFLWAGTAHLSTWNHDLLWAIPFHFIVLFFINKPKHLVWVRKYFTVTAYLYGLLLILWAVLPEPIHMALVPFVLLLLLRSAYISYHMKRPISKQK